MPITAQQARAELARRELERRGQGIAQEGEIQSPSTFKGEQLERTIAQRPDIYGEAVQQARQFPQYFQKGQSGTPFMYLPSLLLKSLGGIAQRGEAALSAPFYEMPRGLGAMARGVKQAITGKKLTEFGDVARQAGLPEPIAAGIGLTLTGGIVKGIGNLLSSKAQQAEKVMSTYGRDIGRTVIKHASGMSDEAVDYGMTKGWKNILTKDNLKPDKGYKLVTKVKSALQNFFRDINKQYGEKLDEIAEQVNLDVPVENMRVSIKNRLLNVGLIDDAGKALRKPDSKAEKMLLELSNNLQNLTGEISLRDIVKLKNKLWTSVRSSALQGNQPINAAERVIFDLQDDIGKALAVASERLPSDRTILSLQDLNNWYATKRNLFNSANSIFRVFKNDYSTKQGESVLRRYFNLDYGTKNLLQDIEMNLGMRFIEPLKDWIITQDFVVQPQSQGFSMYPFRLLAESTKWGTRQTLKGAPTNLIGKGIEATGRGIQSMGRPMIPPAIMRAVTGRNRLEE